MVNKKNLKKLFDMIDKIDTKLDIAHMDEPVEGVTCGYNKNGYPILMMPTDVYLSIRNMKQ